MQLFTRSEGSGSRTAALVHGNSTSSEHWRDFSPYLLDHDLTLILVDQRGHGRSPRADSYRIQDFADDLVDTLPTGLDLLIGQSLGGLSCAWAAERLQPKRFIGVDPALALTPFARRAIPLLGRVQHRLPDRLLNALGQPAEGSPPDTLLRTRAMWAQWDVSSLRDITRSYLDPPFPAGPPAVPSTIVLAQHGFAVERGFADALRAQGWDVRMMKGGHDLHVEDPAGLAAILHDVLEPDTGRATTER